MNHHDHYTCYEWSEIGKHSHEKDAWIVIDGFVYDVTNFLNIHPGGVDIIAEHFGKDATEAFKDPLVHMHSQNALEMMKKFRIGVVKGKAPSPQDTRERFVCAPNLFFVFEQIVFLRSKSVPETFHLHSPPPLSPSPSSLYPFCIALFHLSLLYLSL
jgi:predicted heme/steroid binding protein